MALYSQDQTGLKFTAVLSNVDLPDDPAPYDPGDPGPGAIPIYIDFLRPDGAVLSRPARREDRTPDDPHRNPDLNDNDIFWTTSDADPMIRGLPGVWHYRARAVPPSGTVTSADWIRFEVA